MKRIFILFSLIAILFLHAGVMSSVTIASKIDNHSHSHNYVKMHLQQSNYEVFEVNNQLHSSYYYPGETDLFDDEEMVSLATTYHYVYTPKGTPVQVLQRSPDLTQAQKNYYNQYYDALYPNATRLGTATTNYNCHSYAWYQQSTSNPYWMNDPTSYYTDGSYVESTGNVGEIIVYYDAGGFNLHSGIITARTSGSSNGVLGIANLLTVVSKWGSVGLYEHRGDQCPYTVPYGGTASYIKFYKVAPPPHTHTYTHTWLNLRQHNSSCLCGDTRIRPHIVSSDWDGIGTTTCLDCGGPAELGFVIQSYSSRIDVDMLSMHIEKYFGNGSFILENGVIVLSDEDLELYYNGTLVLPHCCDSLDCDSHCDDCIDCDHHESEIDDSIYLYFDRRGFNYNYYLNRKDEDFFKRQ